jgi:hypothetical protein
MKIYEKATKRVFISDIRSVGRDSAWGWLAYL